MCEKLCRLLCFFGAFSVTILVSYRITAITGSSGRSDDMPLSLRRAKLPSAPSSVRSSRSVRMPSSPRALRKRERVLPEDELVVPRDYMLQLMEFIKNEKEIEIPGYVRKSVNEGVDAFQKMLLESEDAEWFGRVSEKIASIVKEAEMERRKLILKIQGGRAVQGMRNDLKVLKSAFVSVENKLDRIEEKIDRIAQAVRAP